MVVLALYHSLYVSGKVHSYLYLCFFWQNKLLFNFKRLKTKIFKSGLPLSNVWFGGDRAEFWPPPPPPPPTQAKKGGVLPLPPACLA